MSQQQFYLIAKDELEEKFKQFTDELSGIRAELKEERLPQLLTVEQFCDHLQISRATFEKWRRKKDLPLNGRVYVSSDELKKFLMRS